MAVMIDLRGSSVNTENLLRIRSGPANTLKETVHFADFKSLNGIQLSRFVQVSLHF